MIQEWYYAIAASIAVATIVLWLNAQFTKVRGVVEKHVDKVINKLEYHERHDDARFGRIADQLIELRLVNARHGVNGKGQETQS